MREVVVVRSIFGSGFDADISARRRLRQAFALSILIHLLALSLGHPPRLPEAARHLLVFIRPARLSGAENTFPEKRPSPREPAPVERLPLLRAATGKGLPISRGAAPAAALLRAPSAVSETEGELNAEGLRQYRVSLGGAMAGNRAYPAQARQRGWQGRVELLLQVMHGKPPQVVVEKSSTYPLLDSQARDMLRQAVALTPLPESLASRDFALPLTVVFELEEP